MDDVDAAREVLNHQLGEAVAADPLSALTAIGAVQRDITTHQSRAVRAAVQQHSWSEIGEALGVSKQAAHHKFAKAWVVELRGELKSEIKAAKVAMVEGAPDKAAVATAKRDAVIAELRNAGRRHPKA